MYVHVYTHILHTYTHMHIHTYTNVYTYIYKHTCMYMHVMIIIKEGAKNLDRSKGGGVWRGKKRGLM